MCPWKNRAGGNTAKTTNFTQMWHKCWVWWANDGVKKCRSKYFIASMLGDPLFDTDLNAILIIHLWFSISTTRKAMWKWNPLDHVLHCQSKSNDIHLNWAIYILSMASSLVTCANFAALFDFWIAWHVCISSYFLFLFKFKWENICWGNLWVESSAAVFILIPCECCEPNFLM